MESVSGCDKTWDSNEYFSVIISNINNLSLSLQGSLKERQCIFICTQDMVHREDSIPFLFVEKMNE
jgi:hypothetical protein